MTALPARIGGKITRIYVSTSTAEVSFKDQHSVTSKKTMSLSKLYTSVGDESEAKLQEPADDKQLPPLHTCADFVSSPSPREFKDLLFQFESFLLRWFCKARRPALRRWHQATRPAPFESTLAAPYNVLSMAFAAFDSLLVAAIMCTVQPAVSEQDDLRLHAELDHARGLIRTLHDGCRIKFWEMAAQIWRVVRSPEREGGHRLMCRALLAMEAAGAHSCLRCLLSNASACVHACCSQQLLYLGRVRGTLLFDDGYWRVSAHAQEASAAELSSDAPSPAASPQPPGPVTWPKLRGLRFPVVFDSIRHFYRVTEEQDGCSFAALALFAGISVNGALTLRTSMAGYITQRARTDWLQALFRDTKCAEDGTKLADTPARVQKKAPLTLFLLHVFSLLHHVDVYIASPVWDGAPLAAEQIRRHHAKWKVAASEVLCEQKVPPKKLLLAHVCRLNPLSSSKRDFYASTTFLQACSRSAVHSVPSLLNLPCPILQFDAPALAVAAAAAPAAAGLGIVAAADGKSAAAAARQGKNPPV